MTALGRCLVFRLKYPVEMNLLYSDSEEEPDLPEDLPDPKHTMAMVRAVGGKGCEEAAAFLEACQDGIEKHFGALAKCRCLSTNKGMQNKWSIVFGVWPKGKFEPKGKKYVVRVGVNIATSGKNEIIPWVWCNGGESAMEKISSALDHHVDVNTEDLELIKGSVALARIQVMEDNPQGFEVDREPLVEKVIEAFARIKDKDLTYLFSLQ